MTRLFDITRQAARVPELGPLLDVAAAAYDFMAEVEHPAPDLTMRVQARERLSAAIRQLPIEHRAWLAARAGR